MTLHAWIVQVTGLPADKVWQAYQRHAQTPVDGVDCATYHGTGGDLPVFLLERVTAVDEDTVQYTRTGENTYRVTVRLFGPSRDAMAAALHHSRYSSASRNALRPAVAQRISAPVPLREPVGAGWREYLSLDVQLGIVARSVETGPRIKTTEMTGTVEPDELEVKEP